MARVAVLNGVRYKPEHFIDRMEKSKHMEGIECRHINTLYSLCWVFQSVLSAAILSYKNATLYEVRLPCTLIDTH